MTRPTRPTPPHVPATSITHFESVKDLMAIAMLPHRLEGRGNLSRTIDAHQDWDMDLGWDGAVHAATHGHQESLQAVQEAMDRIRESLQDPQDPILVQDVQGPYLDIGEYVSGNPECFRRPMPKPQERPITILMSQGASIRCRASGMQARGAMVAALVSILTERGFTCDVTVGWSFARKFADHALGSYTPTLHLHRPSDTLDLDAFAFWLACPATDRRITFSVAERDPSPAAGNVIHVPSYGFPAPCPIAHGQEAPDIYIPFEEEMNGWTGPDDAIPYLRNLLSDLFPPTQPQA